MLKLVGWVLDKLRPIKVVASGESPVHLGVVHGNVTVTVKLVRPRGRCTRKQQPAQLRREFL